MTDEELCVKAAELSGGRVPDTFCGGDIDEIGAGYWGCSFCSATGFDWGKTEHKRQPPDYPNNIAAAWVLTSNVPECRWSVYELDEGGWAANVMGKIEPLNGHTRWAIVAESGPDTAPRAITKAFIMAMEAE